MLYVFIFPTMTKSSNANKMPRQLCHPTQTYWSFAEHDCFVVFLLSWALLMHLVQLCLVAVVFDEYCFCRLIADWKTVDLSYFYTLDWSDSFCTLTSSNMFSAKLMMFIFSSSGLNGTDDRLSNSVENADYSVKPSELNDFYYSYLFFEIIMSKSAGAVIGNLTMITKSSLIQKWATEESSS